MTFEERLTEIINPKNDMTFVFDARVRQLIEACEDVIGNSVQGAFVETGVYKGGMVALMSAVNRECSGERAIYAFDSFEGCPPPDALKYKYKINEYKGGEYTGTLENVISNLEKSELAGTITFVKGIFKDTLTDSNIPNKIAILRFDADYYSSTLEVLEAMYDRVSVGGYVIIDDYSLDGCREAVHEFIIRRQLNIALKSPYLTQGERWYETPDIRRNPAGVYWKKK